MLLLMIISLYTSRIIFKALGASDFGLYNVVAGFVMMLSFLNSAMSNATQRYLSYELAKKDIYKLKKVFCQIQILHYIIASIVFIIGEIIGVWFLNEIMNIPNDRYFAANVVFQCSLVSTVFSIISVPYNAMLIAHENMKIFAYLGILEAILKLLLCMVIYIVAYDKLIIYAICLMLVSVTLQIIYRLYCRKYQETHFKYIIEKKILKEICGYATWSLCGSLATVANSQGINIIINIFFNTTVNAARGIAYQIDTVVRNFVSNFQTAMNPQIVKSFSLNDLDTMYKYIFWGSKLSFFILLILTVPLIYNLQYLLHLWLGEVPNETIIFTQLVLINSLIVSLSGILSIAAQATGKIKYYQITMGSLLLLNLPIAYILYQNKFPAYSVLIVSIIIEAILVFVRLMFLKKMIQLKIIKYLLNVIKPTCICSILGFTICYYISLLIIGNSIISFITAAFIQVVITVLLIYSIGLTQNEQSIILNVIKKKLKRHE